MKKTLILILVVVMLAAMTGCVGQEERLQSVMKVIQGTISTETTTLQPEKEIIPETVPEPEPDPRDETASAPWPDFVPAPKEYEKVYASVQWEGEFRAHYLMTNAQLIIWQEALEKANYLGEPATNGDWVVEVTATPLAEIKETFRVLIVVAESKENPEWDPQFKEFPVYTTDLPYKSYSITMDGSAIVMDIVIEHETRQRVTAYIQTLIAAGFAEFGYGDYVKEVGGKTYVFQTDGIWAIETEAHLIWRVL